MPAGNREFVIDRFQELDLSLSTYFVSDSSLEDEWIRGVTTALSQKADYKLVR